jgi:hypothetical protein
MLLDFRREVKNDVLEYFFNYLYLHMLPHALIIFYCLCAASTFHMLSYPQIEKAMT